MILRGGRAALAALIIMAPAMALAGDGTFGVPPSGILLPPPPQPPKSPAKTAALVPPDRADLEKQRPVRRVQQTYQPAPAEGAGRSRVVPPSEAPVHSPIVVPPKSKQFKAPVARVDPSYVERIAAGSEELEPARGAAPMPAAPPVMAQGTAPEPKRGLFGLLRRNSQPQMAPVQTTQLQAQSIQTAPTQTAVYASAAAAAYEEHSARAPVQSAYAVQPAAAPQRTASRFSFGGANPSARANDGTPCGQRRGIFTSPPECR